MVVEMVIGLLLVFIMVLWTYDTFERD